MMETKLCRGCREHVSINNFHKKKDTADGLPIYCKDCKREINRHYRENNQDRIIERRREYYQNNKERVKSNVKRWKRENKDRDIFLRARWKKDKLENDPNFRIIYDCRSRISSALDGVDKSDRTHILLGYNTTYASKDEFLSFVRGRLEAAWEPGMSWDNRGDWHIDHIIPLSAFDMTDEDQQRAAFHFTNLQPLWAKDNLSKSDKLIADHIPWKVCELWCLNPHC